MTKMYAQQCYYFKILQLNVCNHNIVSEKRSLDSCRVERYEQILYKIIKNIL